MSGLSKNRNVLLHLSHTDIRSDSRILKELDALTDILNCKIVGMGFELDEIEAPAASYRERLFDVHTRILFTKKWKLLPRSLRHILNFIELTFRLLIFGIRIRPSIVHCHDTPVLMAGWLLKLLTGCKLIYDAHELESNRNGQGRFFSKATLIIEALCWKKIDLLISVSNSIIDWYKRNLGPKASVLVLNSPIYDESKISRIASRESNYFVQRFRIPPTSKIFIYLGILGPGRGIEACIRAFSQIGNRAHLIFIGFGVLEDYIRESSGIHENIHIHPPVKHDEVVPLASSADYGICLIESVSLSDYLCLPNKLFEYSFAGLKVLASNFPEIEKTVADFKLGICCQPNSDAILIAVSSILDSTFQSGDSDISELSWSKQAERLREAYKNLFLINVTNLQN
jgi:glycosyltransferase involved in cell wall biosynthesis